MHRGTSVKTSAKVHTDAYPFNRENPCKGYETDRTHETTLTHAYDAHKSRLEGKMYLFLELKAVRGSCSFQGLI